MLEFEKIKYKGADICVLNNTLQSKELLNLFENKDLYKNELKNIAIEHKRKDFMAVRYALKQCLEGDEYLIFYTPKGKPFLCNDKKKISLSHTKNWVAVITHKNKKVGIDIEKPRKTLVKVAKKFLSDAEYTSYLQFNEEQSFDFLRIVWSAKETLFKIVGDAYNFSEQLCTLPFDLNKKNGALTIVHTETKKEYCVEYLLTEHYTLTYCVDNE